MRELLKEGLNDEKINKIMILDLNLLDNLDKNEEDAFMGHNAIQGTVNSLILEIMIMYGLNVFRLIIKYQLLNLSLI